MKNLLKNIVIVLNFFCLYTPSARVNRIEYLSIHIMSFFNTLIPMSITTLLNMHNWGELTTLPFVLITYLALINCILALVKRLHDIDKSAWLLLLLFLPIVGFIFIIAIYFIPGTNGDNKFGPQPNNTPLKILYQAIARTIVIILLTSCFFYLYPFNIVWDYEFSTVPFLKDYKFNDSPFVEI